MPNLGLTTMSDPPRFFNAENFNTCNSYPNSSPMHSTLPTYTPKANNASSSSTSDHLFGKTETPQLTSGFAPASRLVTPPPSMSTEDQKHSTAPCNTTPKIKTGMTIPEIVEEVVIQPPTPTSVSSLKTQAEGLEPDEEEVAVKKSNVLQVADISPEQGSTEDVPSHNAPVVTFEPPRKKLRLQFAATAVAGAVIGGISVLGALVALPESFFQ